MSIKTRNTLKSEFVSGTAATQSKFEDIFDSQYNKAEDSVLIGPVGLTGTNGLVGPDGATHYNGLIGPSDSHHNGLVGPTGDLHYNGLIGPPGATHHFGLWYDNSGYVPGGANSLGTTGQTIIDSGVIYICVATNTWKKVIGS